MRLNTCEDHEGCIVVYEGYGKCPFCDAIDTSDELKRQKEELEEKIEDLEEKVEELQEHQDE